MLVSAIHQQEPGCGPFWASLVAQMIKHLPAVEETWVQSLGQEDPLEKEMAFPSPASLPGKPHGRRSLIGYSPWGHKEPDMTEQFHFKHLDFLQEQLGTMQDFNERRGLWNEDLL